MPECVVREIGVQSLRIPGETEPMRKAREKIVGLLREIGSARVWGASAAEDFNALLSGFTALQGRRFEAVERGLTAAFSIPEMAWMRDEILLARAKVRLMQGKLKPAAEDLEGVSRRQPVHPEPKYHLGVIYTSLARSAWGRGEDPFPLASKGIEFYNAVLAFGERVGPALLHSERGTAYSLIFEYRVKSGLDGEDANRLAMKDFDEALRRSPGNVVTLRARGEQHRRRGELEEDLGRDPRPAFGKALLDLDCAL
ncbi:MAG: hypothetical protein ACYTFG_12965, partial [Planctomycetota bacterium]